VKWTSRVAFRGEEEGLGVTGKEGQKRAEEGRGGLGSPKGGRGYGRISEGRWIGEGVEKIWKRVCREDADPQRRVKGTSSGGGKPFVAESDKMRFWGGGNWTISTEDKFEREKKRKRGKSKRGVGCS